MSHYKDEENRIYLRKMTYDDTDFIVSWRNKDSVRKNFIYQALFTRESHENWIRNVIETGKAEQFIICLCENDKPIGSVYIRDVDNVHNKAEYGIFIGEEDARGMGYGSLAAKLMLQYCFEEKKLHKVFLRVYADNERAIGSYENAGFEKEAYLKDEVCIDGVYRDMVFMAKINPNDK